jgi:preprotein translocase subunit SecF
MEKVLKRLSFISTRTLVYLLIATSLICVIALRQNNQEMVKLRNQVYVADKKNGDVNKALNNLRSYVYAHMNTNLSSGNNNIKPPIQLKYTYQRLYEAKVDKVQTENQKIYTAAQNYCQSINQAFFGTTRVPCVQNYVVKHGVKAAEISIPAGLYQFDFISPSWSSDLAGWSLIATIILLITLIIKFTVTKFRN